MVQTSETTCPRPHSKIVAASELWGFLSPDLVHQEFRVSEQGVTRWGHGDMRLVYWRQVIVTEAGFRLMRGGGEGGNAGRGGVEGREWGGKYIDTEPTLCLDWKSGVHLHIRGYLTWTSGFLASLKKTSVSGSQTDFTQGDNWPERGCCSIKRGTWSWIKK